MKYFLDQNYKFTKNKTDNFIDIDIDISDELMYEIESFIDTFDISKKLENMTKLFLIINKVLNSSNSIVPVIKNNFTNSENFSLFLKTNIRKTNNMFTSISDKNIIDFYQKQKNTSLEKTFINLLEEWAIENKIVYRKKMERGFNFYGIELVSN